jgi:hypothetical protein
MTASRLHSPIEAASRRPTHAPSSGFAVPNHGPDERGEALEAARNPKPQVDPQAGRAECERPEAQRRLLAERRARHAAKVTAANTSISEAASRIRSELIVPSTARRDAVRPESRKMRRNSPPRAASTVLPMYPIGISAAASAR